MIKIEFHDSLSPDLAKKMEEGLLEYETKNRINVNFKRFCFVIREEHEIVGILNAFHSYNSVHIEDLWIEATHRGKGYGRKLIEALENYFMGNGFNNINTVICAFQALDFYRKCGFKEEFVRTNRQDPNLTMTFFVKFFDDSSN